MTTELLPQAETDIENRPRTTTERKTKIVCTVGPACEQPEQIRALLEAGANVFRLNFSHADHAWHSQVLQIIRREAEALDYPVAVMQDLCGPKIRVSRAAGDKFPAREGDTLRITTDRILADMDEELADCMFDLSTTYEPLLQDVHRGDKILIDDGRVELVVEDVQHDHVKARVVREGTIQPGKGLNLPGVSLSTESVTAKDWQDLQWGIENRVDYIALSFVRHPDDLLAVRTRLDEANCDAELIAKIERPEAIEHIDRIIEFTDGLMVARGDLGLETDLARVPLLQKQLIESCRRSAKPVITATQMLDSMVDQSAPTRAEVSDVANAIFDGSDAIMLSNETAVGRFPTKAVDCLNRIALVTEEGIRRGLADDRYHAGQETSVCALTEAAAVMARRLEAKRVVVYSQSGYTARMMARFRLPMSIVAVTNLDTTYRKLALSFGVAPVYLPEIVDMRQLLGVIDDLAVKRGWASPGDTLVVVSAFDGRDGIIDTLHVHRVS